MSQLAPTVEFYEDAAGEWRWRVKAGNGEPIAQGEGHRDQHDAERAFTTAGRLITELHAELTRPEPVVEVYTRDECIFQYCPSPETCRDEGCQSPRTRTSQGPIAR